MQPFNVYLLQHIMNQHQLHFIFICVSRVSFNHSQPLYIWNDLMFSIICVCVCAFVVVVVVGMRLLLIFRFGVCFPVFPSTTFCFFYLRMLRSYFYWRRRFFFFLFHCYFTWFFGVCNRISYIIFWKINPFTHSKYEYKYTPNLYSFLFRSFFQFFYIESWFFVLLLLLNVHLIRFALLTIFAYCFLFHDV